MIASFLQPTTPESARALSLVGRHHGVVSRNGVSEFEGMEKQGARIPWRKGGVANHLVATRRKAKMDEISAKSLPAILELKGGEHFVIVKEQADENLVRVQFPDSRESLIDRERLAESYSGHAIFLRKRTDGIDQKTMRGGNRLLRRRHFPLRRLCREQSFRLTLGFNLLFLAMTFLMVGAHQYFYGSLGHPSAGLTFMSIVSGAAICIGLLRLRREWVREGRFASMADFLTIPFFAVTLCVLAGWTALPFAVVTVGAGVGYLFSGYLPVLGSGSRGKRRVFLTGVFGVSAAMAWGFAAQGLLSPAAITGSLVLGTYLVNLFINSDSLWQYLNLSPLR